MSDFSLILVLQIKTSVNVDVHLVAVSANCTVAVDIPMTVDEVIHIAVIPLAIQNHILKIEFSRF